MWNTNRFLTILLLTIGASSANAGLLFADDFESGLGQWTGTGGGSHYGVTIVDPFDATNQVLAFSQTKSWGDVFSLASFTSVSGFSLSFDYLGMCEVSDCGGYVGWSRDFLGFGQWLYSTGSASGSADVLADGIGWNHYTFQFQVDGPIRLMLEDFVGVGWDALFDNIELSSLDVPSAVSEPGTFWLLLIALAGLSLTHSRARRGAVTPGSAA